MLIFNGYAIEQQVMKDFIADDQIRLCAWAIRCITFLQHGNREMGIDGL